MSNFLTPTGSAPRGLQPDQDTVPVINRTGGTTAIGQLVAFDLHNTDGSVSNNTTSNEASGLANVVSPATAYLSSGLFAICLEAAADDAEMRVVVRGRVDVLTDAAAALTARFSAIDGQDEADVGAVASGSKILGQPLTATAAAGLCDGLFNGIEGFGQG